MSDSESSRDSSEEPEEYHVEKVTGRRRKRDGTLEYRIKWLGYNEVTWESQENCNCPEKIEEFESKLTKDKEDKKETRPRAARRSSERDDDSKQDSDDGGKKKRGAKRKKTNLVESGEDESGSDDDSAPKKKRKTERTPKKAANGSGSKSRKKRADSDNEEDEPEENDDKEDEKKKETNRRSDRPTLSVKEDTPETKVKGKKKTMQPSPKKEKETKSSSKKKEEEKEKSPQKIRESTKLPSSEEVDEDDDEEKDEEAEEVPMEEGDSVEGEGEETANFLKVEIEGVLSKITSKRWKNGKGKTVYSVPHNEAVKRACVELPFQKSDVIFENKEDYQLGKGAIIEVILGINRDLEEPRLLCRYDEGTEPRMELVPMKFVREDASERLLDFFTEFVKYS